jgi:hypothetical protein
MGKKKAPVTAGGKAAAKAAKKAKAASKIERKEGKKLKSKDKDEGGEDDLEAILDKVCCLPFIYIMSSDEDVMVIVDAKRMGRSS